MDTYSLEKLSGWTPELSPPPDSPLYRARTLAGEMRSVIVAALGNDSDQDTLEMSFRGASKTRTRNLEIPGLVLRTIPE
jgi:hypothetical protein